MARSWLEKLLLCWWCNQPNCWRTFAWFGSRSSTRWYAALALSYYRPVVSVMELVATYMGAAYVFMLFMHVADLEPDVFLRQWAGWRVDDVFEALGAKSVISS